MFTGDLITIAQQAGLGVSQAAWRQNLIAAGDAGPFLNIILQLPPRSASKRHSKL